MGVVMGGCDDGEGVVMMKVCRSEGVMVRVCMSEGMLVCKQSHRSISTSSQTLCVTRLTHTRDRILVQPTVRV